ncbi:amidase family protein [Hydrocarboniphaga sp.]|uniref:amidase family protein n=1 Tax=Hydrocarboniphaga sp. TaxID=2033016 RepID=UPI003D0D9ACE
MKSTLRFTAITTSLLLSACGSSSPSSDEGDGSAPTKFVIEEASVADLHAAFAGRQILDDGSALTCVKLYDMYVARINAIDDYPQAGGLPINGVLRINPQARAEAEALDVLYAKEGIGKRNMHCVPMLLKDNYDTYDHPSTSGSYSMLGHQAGIDAHAVAGLRRAGALILGKANQDEFAFTVSGTSGRGPLTRNPYDTAQDPGGSSSGSGASIAANFATIGTGTDTCMSIRFPSSVNGLVGIRPSVGLVSQHGVFPLTHARDAPGPMARSVRDAALALSAMAGADPADAKTLQYENAAFPQRPGDYTRFLDRAHYGLKGRRIGFVRQFGALDSAGSGEHLALIEAAITQMRAQGAQVVDISLPDFVSASASAMHYEWNEYFRNFEAENAYAAPRRCLTALNPGSNRCSLPDFDGILETGLVSAVAIASVGAAALTDSDIGPDPAILQQHADTRAYVQAAMDAQHLDALLIRPGSSPRTCDFGSTTQMPSVVVPIGFTADGVPKGVEILARKWDEPTAIGIAYDYEQATHWRKQPTLRANPLAGTLIVDEFNRAREDLLLNILDQDPQSLPLDAYLRVIRDYVSGFTEIPGAG